MDKKKPGFLRAFAGLILLILIIVGVYLVVQAFLCSISADHDIQSQASMYGSAAVDVLGAAGLLFIISNILALIFAGADAVDNYLESDEGKEIVNGVKHRIKQDIKRDLGIHDNDPLKIRRK